MTLLALALLLQDAATTTDTPVDPNAMPIAPAHTGALMDMLHNSGPTALVVLGILLVMSICSWAVMLSKWRSFANAEKKNRAFLRGFRKSGRLSEVAGFADNFRPSPRSRTSISASPAVAAHRPTRKR
jgi:biopolymer transport protein TolQ